MAIYTKVDTHEAKFILKNYNLGELKKIQGIKKGIENTNYLLKSNKNINCFKDTLIITL